MNKINTTRLCFSVIFGGVVLFLSCSKKGSVQHLKNPSLETIKPSYPGNTFHKGRFINYEPVALPSFGKVLKWRFSKNPQHDEKKNDTWLPEVFRNETIFADKRNKIVWLGHASFLITLNGKNILTDPVFGDVPLVKRLVGLPFAPDEVRNIDYVLLSHGHFDHCDKMSLKLVYKNNPHVKVYTPLMLGHVVQSKSGIANITEAGWYQKFRSESDSIEIFLMPAFHWYKRSFNDNNKSLWGSYVIRYKGKTIYFMGDSGYNEHYKEIASMIPDIDYCLMGVGAYQPSYIMKTSHHTPEEAVQSFHDLKGKYFIPMHYGTYDLADEPLGEPLRKLQGMDAEGKINGSLVSLKIGEAFLLTD